MLMTLILSRFARIVANPRLYIEYALVGVVIVLAAAAFTFHFQKERLNLSVERLTTQSELFLRVNRAQQEVINELTVQRVRDAEAVGKLARDLEGLSTTDRRTRKQLHELERSNEAVRDYLNEPLPAQLRCVLEESCGHGYGAAVDSSRATLAPARTLLRPP